ncbi:MAG: hypothetical protein J0I02_12800 [Alphaproteobacteria bacterium]|nr:hypothetical protein [Alphaproteobacteria bacterium]
MALSQKPDNPQRHEHFRCPQARRREIYHPPPFVIAVGGYDIVVRSNELQDFPPSITHCRSFYSAALSLRVGLARLAAAGLAAADFVTVGLAADDFAAVGLAAADLIAAGLAIWAARFFSSVFRYCPV